MARVLIITYEFPPVGGGTGKAALGTARKLQELGHEVAILTSQFQNLAADEMLDGIRVLRIKVLRRYLNYANAIEVLSFAIAGMAEAKRILIKFVPDIVLASLTIPSGIVAMGINRLAGIPYITFVRGQDVPGHPELNPWLHKLAWPVTSRVWRQAERVIANSEGLADLVRAAEPALRVEVIHNAIDTDLYVPNDSMRAPSENRPVRAAYVGRLVKVKRIREIVAAWAIARLKAGVPIELCIAGFGPEQSAIEAMIRQHDLGQNVRLLGRIEEPEVISLLQSSDFFINASKMEGLPNAVLEAMACGLPVLLSDIAPHREILRNGEGGIFCDGANVENLADAMLQLIAYPEARQAMGRQARGVVEEQFTWDRLAQQLVALFPEDDTTDGS